MSSLLSIKMLLKTFASATYLHPTAKTLWPNLNARSPTLTVVYSKIQAQIFIARNQTNRISSSLTISSRGLSSTLSMIKVHLGFVRMSKLSIFNLDKSRESISGFSLHHHLTKQGLWRVVRLNRVVPLAWENLTQSGRSLKSYRQSIVVLCTHLRTTS